MKNGYMTGVLFRYFNGEENSLRKLADVGFDALDLSHYIHFTYKNGIPDGKLHTYTEEDKAYLIGLATLARNLGIEPYQVHAPFPSVNVNDETYTKYAMQATKNSIDAAGASKIPYIVIHPIATYGLDADRTWELNRDFYVSLIPDLKKAGIKACLENIFTIHPKTKRPCPIACSFASELRDYIDELNAIAGEERFVACIDIGHCLLLDLDPAAMIRSLGHRVKALHVHDNDGYTDQHTVPGHGIADWDSIMQALEDIDYEGTLSSEACGFTEKCGPENAMETCRIIYQTHKKLLSKIQKNDNSSNK